MDYRLGVVIAWISISAIWSFYRMCKYVRLLKKLLTLRDQDRWLANSYFTYIAVLNDYLKAQEFKLDAETNSKLNQMLDDIKVVIRLAMDSQEALYPKLIQEGIIPKVEVKKPRVKESETNESKSDRV